MKNKTTLILGILFAVLLIYYLAISLNPPEVTTGADPLFEGEPPDIDRVEFSRSRRGDIVLERRNDTWYMTKPFEFKAYDRQVEGMLEDLYNTYIDLDEVDNNPEAFDRYAVGETSGTSFKAFSDGGMVLDVIVGRQTKEIGHSYVRRNGSNTVELWRGMLSQDVILRAEDWRDKVLFKINETDIISVEAVEGDTSRKLTLEGQIWEYTENGTSKEVDLVNAQSAVSTLAGLIGDNFAGGNEIPRAGSREPDVLTTFTVRNGDRHTLEIWAPDNQSPRYLVRKSGGDVLYTLTNVKGEKIILEYDALK